MKAIAIPHDELAFPNLARAIKLPVRTREDAKSPIEASGLSRRQQRKLRLA